MEKRLFKNHFLQALYMFFIHFFKSKLSSQDSVDFPDSVDYEEDPRCHQNYYKG